MDHQHQTVKNSLEELLRSAVGPSDMRLCRKSNHKHSLIERSNCGGAKGWSRSRVISGMTPLRRIWIEEAFSKE